jgi:hypothetical protein
VCPAVVFRVFISAYSLPKFWLCFDVFHYFEMCSSFLSLNIAFVPFPFYFASEQSRPFEYYVLWVLLSVGFSLDIFYWCILQFTTPVFGYIYSIIKST